MWTESQIIGYFQTQGQILKLDLKVELRPLPTWKGCVPIMDTPNLLLLVQQLLGSKFFFAKESFKKKKKHVIEFPVVPIAVF